MAFHQRGANLSRVILRLQGWHEEWREKRWKRIGEGEAKEMEGERGGEGDERNGKNDRVSGRRWNGSKSLSVGTCD